MSEIDRLDDPWAEAAIEWMVELGAGTASERQVRAFEAWLHADARNEAAWIRLQEGLMPYGVASRQGTLRDLLRPVRSRRPPSRRSVLTGLVAVVGAGGAAGSLANRFVPLDGVLADHFTYTGEQQNVRLADGSELVLAPRTAVNVRYEPGLRGIQLVEGEVLVRAASRATPFHASLGALTLRTQSGEFVLDRRGAALSVTGVQGAGELEGPDLGRVQSVALGDLIEVVEGRVRRSTTDREAATAWLSKLLVATDRPLAAVVDKLRPYFPGVIRLDPAIASLRVTGVFSLKDPNAVLDSLAETLGLSVSRIAGYWVSLGPTRS
ncbi:FecR family protein [Methylorubrum thiocyanatum]